MNHYHLFSVLLKQCQLLDLFTFHAFSIRYNLTRNWHYKTLYFTAIFCFVGNDYAQKAL
jgi:hypothetical protein